MSAFVEKPPYWINRAAFLFRSELARAFADAGIDVTPEEWALQMVLYEKPVLSVGDLAELTLRDRTTVTRFVDTLVRKGLATRKPDPKDRRRLLVSLSPSGRERFPEMLEHVGELIARSTRGIEQAEIDTTLSVLKRMIRNIAGD